MTTPVDLLVLDVHGVVLNNPFRTFLRTLATRTEQDPVELETRWDEELRLPTWLGRTGDAELWSALLGRDALPRSSAWWRARLEGTYALGPAAPLLERWHEHVSIWLLSNHRASWLKPRLDRMGLDAHVDRVLVSDELGAVKPAPEAFEPILRAYPDPSRVLFVDDQLHNVTAARSFGLRAVHLQPDERSLRVIDKLVRHQHVERHVRAV